MQDPKLTSESAADLRKRAEETLSQVPAQNKSLSTEDTQHLLHELQVHQIELKMQNEELRRAQAEIEASRDKYADLYDFAPVAYFTIGEKGRIEEANLTGAILLGVERSILIGQHLSRYVPQEHQNAFFLNRKKTLNTLEPEMCEINFIKADHTRFNGELKSIAIADTETNKNRYRVSINDITKRVASEIELQKTNLESLGFLAGGIAHDFNNILTPIFASLQMLQLILQKNTPAYEHVQDAWNAVQRTKGLTTQLLTFATGGIPIKEVVPIEELIQQVTALSLSGSSVKPNYSFSKDLLAVDIDVNQFSRVIQNLVINAHQAMPDGGIVNISAENVTLPDQSMYKLKAGTYIKILFKDQGTGMSNDVMRHVFDPYFSTKQAGHGLGLSIVHSIISRHNGHIVVQSEIGKGTTFEILLPVSIKQAVNVDTFSSPYPKGTAKVLLMDDEEIIRRTIGRLLEKLGYAVDAVEDGTQALHMYQTSAEAGAPYQIVIMDLTIPGGMGGKEAVQALHQKYPDARAVVTSGYANDPVMSDYKKYGFQGCIHKPIDLLALTETLERVLAE